MPPPQEAKVSLFHLSWKYSRCPKMCCLASLSRWLAVLLQPLYDELKRAVEFYGNYLSTQSGQVPVVALPYIAQCFQQALEHVLE